MKNFQKYRYFNSDSKVVAVSSYAGQPVRGIAKCNPNDSFDLETGKKLAAARCWVKIAEKRCKAMNKKYKDAVKEAKAAEAKVGQFVVWIREAELEAADAQAHLESLENSMKAYRD